MKLEKINDNQIRCTLTMHDLDERQMKISELAIGSEKTRDLFHEMMAQAYIELGFEADNAPLMVEAMPVSKDSIVLVITKVSNSEDGEGPDLSRVFEHLFAARRQDETGMDPDREEAMEPESADLYVSPSCFAFDSLEDVSALCRLIEPFFDGESILCRDPEEKIYYLVLEKGPEESSHFSRACGLASDFGMAVPAVYGTRAFFMEHFPMIAEENAVDLLAGL